MSFSYDERINCQIVGSVSGFLRSLIPFVYDEIHTHLLQLSDRVSVDSYNVRDIRRWDPVFQQLKYSRHTPLCQLKTVHFEEILLCIRFSTARASVPMLMYFVNGWYARQKRNVGQTHLANMFPATWPPQQQHTLSPSCGYSEITIYSFLFYFNFFAYKLLIFHPDCGIKYMSHNSLLGLCLFGHLHYTAFGALWLILFRLYTRI